MNRKITFNIIYLSSTLIALIIFAFLVYRWYNVILSDAKNDHQNQQLAMSRISAIGIETFFSRLIDEMDALYYSSNDLVNIDNLTTMVSSNYINKENIKGIYYLVNDKINVVVGSTLTDNEKTQSIKNHSSDVFISKIYTDSLVENSKYFFFCKNYMSGIRNGKVLLVKIDLNNLIEKYVLPIKLTKSDYAWILDNTGTLIYHRSHQEMLNNL